MAWVALVIVLALLEFLVFLLMVGRARGRYGIAAPATTGHEVFERHFRVQQNTMEQLLLFLPSIWLFASFISATWAAALGAIFLVGRALYAVSYVGDPKNRGLGFALSMLPNMALMLGALIGAIRGIITMASVG
ncbi:MAG TPA: MAPEG family protein [Steroidobacteraceae bacterium]|nr:MAPEG family protein [Steroidobacteraceae bacterium]